jgi:hypothetical protein
MAGREPLDDPRGVVGRAIVDDQQLEHPIGRGENGADDGFDRLGFVAGGNDDGDERPLDRSDVAQIGATVGEPDEIRERGEPRQCREQLGDRHQTGGAG